MRLEIALLVALPLLVGWTGMRGGGNRAGTGHCPSALDEGGPHVIRPHTSTYQDGATTRPLWTRAEVAQCEGCIVLFGGDEQQVNIASSTSIPSQFSTAFAIHVAPVSPSTSTEFSTANLKKYVDDVKVKVPTGKQGPLFFLDPREDLLSRQQLAFNEVGFSVPASGVLRTDRVFSSFADWFETAGPPTPAGYSECRNPKDGGTTYNAGELWDASPGTGCNTTEAGKRLVDLLNGKSGGLGATAARSMPPATAATLMFSSTHVLADLLDSGYRTAEINFEQRLIQQLGVYGFEIAWKGHFFARIDPDPTLGLVPILWWMDTGDGLSGHSGKEPCTGTGDITLTLNTLTEYVGACGGGTFSGPPKRADGITAWEYDEYVAGILALANDRFNASPRIPYLVRVNPHWYQGCDWSWRVDANYTNDDSDPGENCRDQFDKAGTTANEAASIREIVQRATHVLIDLAGMRPNQPVDDPPPIPVHGGIGAGGGAGMSYEQLKAMIEGGTVGFAPRVVGYVAAEDAPFFRTATKACVDPTQIPEGVIP